LFFRDRFFFDNTKGFTNRLKKGGSGKMSTTGVRTSVEELKQQFEIDVDPFWNETNQARLAKSIAKLEAGKGKPHELFEH
jgi:hypothetical protein